MEENSPVSKGPTAWKLAGLSLGVVVVYWLVNEHWGHVLGALPYLILLACPLMHLFHGHGGHGGSGDKH